MSGLYLFDNWHPVGYKRDGYRRSRRRLPTYLDALIRYEPLPYPNQLTLVVNEEWHQKDPTLGWRDLAHGGLETHILAGNHHILKADRVAATAEVLRACLDVTDSHDTKEHGTEATISSAGA